MKIRILPLLLNHYKLFNNVPENIAFGFAAYLTFMKVASQKDGKYYGDYNGIDYLITDDSAAYFNELAGKTSSDYVKTVLGDVDFWKTDLNLLDGFVQAVSEKFDSIQKNGIVNALTGLNTAKVI